MRETWSRMEGWDLVLPPSRPSEEDLARIREIAAPISRALPVGVLGSTPEFRDLLCEEGFESVLIFERDLSFYERMTALCAEDLQEIVVEGDWLETLPTHRGELALLLSDLTSGNLPYSQRPLFYDLVAGALAPGGHFVDRVLTNEAPLVTLDELAERYRNAPLNLESANRFSCEALFCSELLTETETVDTTRFYDRLQTELPSKRLRSIAASAERVTPRDCVWYYGRPWSRLVVDYPDDLQMTARHGMPSGSAYAGRAFQYQWTRRRDKMSLDRTLVEDWLTELKTAWEAGDPERALKLFESTVEYYERPFEPGTNMDDYRRYWQDIVGLEEIKFDFELVALDGGTACVHWVNKFYSPEESRSYHLDGVFVIEFDDEACCRVFRQWWFMKD